MSKYSIVTINGASGPFIAETFNKLGEEASFNTYRRLDDDETAVIVSYQHGSFAWVMTSHFLENILKSFNDGDPSIFEAWEEHWIGSDVITSPLEITPETWAKHVIDSYNHIGKYAPLNGLYEEIEKVVQNDNCTKFHIELENLITHPESVIRYIGEITEKDIDDIKEEFLEEWEAKRKLMKPWLDAIIAYNDGSTNLTINHFGTTIQLTV